MSDEQMMNNSRGRILVVKGVSKYNVLRRAAEETAKGFESCGYEVEIADSTQPDFDVMMLFKNSYDMIFMPQASLFSVTLRDGRPLVSVIPSV